MITIKLSRYSNDEVDELRRICYFAKAQIVCFENECSKCKYKHVCDDICSLEQFLIDEQARDYPHCKK